MNGDRKILVILEQSRDYELLTTLLGKNYEIIRPGKFPDATLKYDLIITDGVTHNRYRESLAEEKARANPLFLPILLLTGKKDVNIAASFLWKTIDEIIIMPANKTELHARVEILLRARQQSIESGKLKEKLATIQSRHLNLAVSYAGIGLWNWDPHTNTSYYSPEWKAQIGYQDHEIGNSFAEWESRLHPTDRERAMTAFQDYIKHPVGIYKNEFRLKHKDGSYRWILSQASFEYDSEGNKSRLLGAHIDITEKKQAEERIQKSEQRFRTIFENSLAVMLLIDPETQKILAANNAAEKFYGWGKDLLVKMKISDINTLSPNEIKTEMEKARESKCNYFRFKHRLASGKVRDVEVYNGKVEIDGKDYLHSIIHDISEQVEAEAALRKSEERFRVAQEFSPDGFTILHPVRNHKNEITDFIWVYENPTIARINGTNPESVKGRRLLELFPSHKGTPVFEAYINVANTGKPQIMDEVYAGEIVTVPTWLRLVVVPMGDDIAILSQDITEQKQSNEFVRNERNFMNALLDGLPGIFYFFDDSFNFLRWNENFEKVSGYSADKIARMSPLDFFPDDEKDLLKKQISEVFIKGYADVEANFLSKDGKRTPYYFNGFKLRYNNKDCLIGIGIDIAERKKAELQLAESEELLRLSTELANVAAWEYNFETNSMTRSKNHDSLFGMEEQKEWHFDTFLKATHPDDRELSNAAIQNSVAKGGPDEYKFDFRVIYPDQSVHWLNAIGKVTRRNEKGEGVLVRGFLIDITERKQAEEGQAWLLNIIDQSRNEIYVFDENTLHFEFVNQGALNNLGFTLDEMKAMTPFDIKPEISEESFRKMLKPMRDGSRERLIFETLHQRKNGSTYPVEVYLQFQKSKDKNVFLAVINDITERKKSEQQLLHFHELMKYIIEHNQSAIAVHDKNLNYIYVSQRYLTDYRVKDHNIIGKHHYEVFPDIPEKWRKVHQLALKGIVSKADEDIFYREDGTTDWTRWECRPWYEADGSIGGIIVYTEVINEQKHKELEIRKLNQRLKILIESIQQLSSAQSLDKVQDIVAKYARQLIGADGATLILCENGYSFYVNEDAIQPLWKGKKFPMDSCISGWVMQNKQPVVIEDIYTDERVQTHLYRPTFVKSLAMVPINLKEPIGAIGNYWKEKYAPTETEVQLLQTLADAAARAIENIQLYNELEERVKRRTEQLNAVNKQLETFTYSVSHDLKAPLRGIDGFSKLLLDEYGDKLNEEANHFIQVIRKSTLQMNQLIDDLLRYSRLERSEMKMERISLKSFVESILGSYHGELKGKGFTLQLHIPETEIVADVTGLSIALRNFIENAIKFTSGTPDPQIEIGMDDNPDSWIICVKDNGVGFDMKYHDRIFEIFQRLHRAEEFPGTGIGLSLVAKALSRMGGKAWAKSTPGQGATFFMEIPKINTL